MAERTPKEKRRGPGRGRLKRFNKDFEGKIGPGHGEELLFPEKTPLVEPPPTRKSRKRKLTASRRRNRRLG